MNLFPKSPKFFDWFEELAQIIAQAGKLLVGVPIGGRKIEEVAVRARTLELKADRICHRISREAGASFITPIDREDIDGLAESLDEVVDGIENVVSILAVYKVNGDGSKFKQFSRLIELTTREVLRLIKLLSFKDKKVKDMKRVVVKIHSLENKGDRLIREALGELFATEAKRPVELIKWKDVYETMECVLDECEEIADRVAQIIVKNY